MLSETQKKRLSELDVRSRGLLEDAAKAKATDQKTLIIGLGGMGGRVISRVKTELARRVNYNDTQIRLLAIDSDIKDLKSIQADNASQVGLKEGEETFQIYFPHADDILLKENTRPEYFKKWLNKDYCHSVNGYGAGQIRQAGRALLTGDYYSKLSMNIKESIMKLCGVGVLSQLEVNIVAGIAGGTGSGSFIDMPNIVRQVFAELKGENWESSIKINGYILMPSVMFNLPSVQPTKRTLFSINGYAALKELDYYMGIPNRADAFGLFDEEFDYPQGKSIKLRNPGSLYNMCTLFSGVIGDAFAANMDNYAVDVAAETILNTLIDTTQEEFVDGQMKQIRFHIGKSFLDNCDNARGDLEANPPSDTIFAKDAYLRYCATGVATAVIPSDAIASYVGANVFGMLLTSKFRKGEKVSVSVIKPFVTHALKTTKAMFGTINSDSNYKVTVPEDVRPTFKEVSADKLQTFEAIIANKKLALSASREKLVDAAINSATDQFKAQCRKYLLESGPYGLVQMFKMYRDPNNNATCEGLLQTISGFEVELNTIISDQENLRSQNFSKREATKNEITNAGFFTKLLPALQESKVNAYVKYALDGANNEILKEAAMLLRDEMHRFTDFVREYASNCEKLTEVLDEIERILAGGKAIFVDERNAATAQKYNLNLLDPVQKQSMYNWAKIKLDQVVSEVNLPRMHQKIIEDFLTNSLNWVDNDQKFVAQKVIKELFSSEFGSSVKITIKDYFDRTLALSGEVGVQNEVQNICNTIQSYSEPMYGFISGYPQRAKESSNAYVIVPNNLDPQVKAAFENYAKMNNMQISFSNAIGQITCYKIVTGLPLYADTFMTVYEGEYLAGNISCQHRNERLDDETNLTWKHYPPIISNTVWSAMKDNYKNADEEKFLAETFLPLMEKARSAGILRRQGGTGYSAKLIQEDETRIIDAALDYRDNHVGGRQAIPKGAALFDTLFNAGNENIVVPVSLKKQTLDSVTGDDEKDFNNACVIIRKHVPLYLKIKETLRLYEAAERIIDERNEGVLLAGATNAFLGAVGAGLIYEECKVDPVTSKKKEVRWRLRQGDSSYKLLIDVDRARFIDEMKPLVKDELLHYAVFKEYFRQIDENTRAQVAEMAKKIIEVVDLDDFRSKRAVFMKSAQNFIDKYDGVINGFTRDELCAVIGRDEYEKAALFYNTCAEMDE